eukprot:TRINITY_DN13452_c0_g1_i2.p1 TRINITY_DN13452_c0_g1~~TRINITY_DN13452_c0_g1_i2.p1  ORF type:complete len:424 (-),score=82.89 TRINITY_DN13452_c0_g1_i2:369-1640(-)
MDKIVFTQSCIRSFNTQSFYFRYKQEKRLELPQGLLTTEKNYLNNLECVIRVFYDPLLKETQGEHPFLTMNHIREIFSCVNVVYNITNQFFSALKVQVENGNHSTAQIGTLFLGLKKQGAKVYQRFSVNFQNVGERLLALKTSNSKFREFFSLAENNYMWQGRDLEACLFQVVQRPLQYCIFLKHLTSVTPDDHPDYPNLLKAREEIIKMFEEITESVNLEKEKHLVIKLEKQIVGFQDLAIEGRRLVHRVSIKELSPSNGYLELFLFSDLLLLTEPEKNNKFIVSESLLIVEDGTFNLRLRKGNGVVNKLVCGVLWRDIVRQWEFSEENEKNIFVSRFKSVVAALGITVDPMSDDTAQVRKISSFKKSSSSVICTRSVIPVIDSCSRWLYLCVPLSCWERKKILVKLNLSSIREDIYLPRKF